VTSSGHDTFIRIDKNGNFQEADKDFVWKTLLSSIPDIYEFDNWLVARYIHFSYQRLDEMKQEHARIREELEDTAEIDEETGEVKYDKELVNLAKQLVDKINREASILKKNNLVKMKNSKMLKLMFYIIKKIIL
jgi:hypothetical protein